MRAIDGDALLEYLQMLPIDLGYREVEEIEEYVKGMPTIEERKRGKWIPQDFNKSDGMITTAVYYYPKCSVCGWSANNTNFCPNCGADMRGEKCPVNFVKP